MSRRHLTFACQGARLAGTLDEAPSSCGLLIVTGGNEVRSGPWNSQAQLAARISAAGFPVFRYDRRGVGDSEGVNTGYASAQADIGAAIRAFREEVPGLDRIVAYGNCDAASALMLARGEGCHGLVLSNPWTFDVQPQADSAAAVPASALRTHYLRRLANPRALWRLLTGKVAIGQLASGLAKASRPDGPQSALARQMEAGIGSFAGPIAILLAERDRTAQAFLANWDKADPRIRQCPGASHSFVEADARSWLVSQLLSALHG